MADPTPKRMFGGGGQPVATSRRADNRRVDPAHVGDAVAGALAQALARARGESPCVSTGIGPLDTAIDGGLEPGWLVVIGARPGAGKSALSLWLSRHAARKHPVLRWDIELDLEQLGRRLLCAEAADCGGKPVPYRVLRRASSEAELDQYAPALSAAASRLQALDLWTVPELVGIDEIERVTPRWIRARGGSTPLVIIDYLQIIVPTEREKNSKREQVVADWSRRLKAMAKSLRCVVVALVQINREADKTKDGRPLMSHIRESGALEQDADAVWLLWPQPAKQGERLCEVKILVPKMREAKSRNEDVSVMFDGNTHGFTAR